MSVGPIKFEEVINEKSTAEFTMQLAFVSPFSLAAIASITLTLFNVEDRSIINNRLSQDVFNLNDVTLDSSGLLTYQMTPLDTIIVDPDTPFDAIETHQASFKVVYNMTSVANLDVYFKIRNLRDLP